jgi:hypothetical protein
VKVPGDLTIALCLSIATGVAWLVAIYSETGARRLIENTAFSLIAIAASVLAFDYWLSPTYSIIALIFAGPVMALLGIVGGQALKRILMSRLSRPRT